MNRPMVESIEHDSSAWKGWGQYHYRIELATQKTHLQHVSACGFRVTETGALVLFACGHEYGTGQPRVHNDTDFMSIAPGHWVSICMDSPVDGSVVGLKVEHVERG